MTDATDAPTRLTDEQLATIRAHLGATKPATNGLIAELAQSVTDRREHDHPQNTEDFFCANLSGWAGDRIATVLRRLVDAEIEAGLLRAELAELKMTPHERANAHVRALREAGDLESALAAAEAYEAAAAYDMAHPRI